MFYFTRDLFELKRAIFELEIAISNRLEKIVDTQSKKGIAISKIMIFRKKIGNQRISFLSAVFLEQFDK